MKYFKLDGIEMDISGKAFFYERKERHEAWSKAVHKQDVAILDAFCVAISLYAGSSDTDTVAVGEEVIHWVCNNVSSSSMEHIFPDYFLHVLIEYMIKGHHKEDIFQIPTDDEYNTWVSDGRPN